MNDKELCSIDGCEKPAKARGWCGMHHERQRRNNGDLERQPMGGPRPGSGRKRQVDPGYMGVHNRLFKQGPASQYPCAACLKPAASWAYDHADTNEKIGGPSGKLKYSTDLSHYIPLCTPCHVAFGMGYRKAKLTQTPDSSPTKFQ